MLSGKTCCSCNLSAGTQTCILHLLCDLTVIIYFNIFILLSAYHLSFYLSMYL